MSHLLVVRFKFLKELHLAPLENLSVRRNVAMFSCSCLAFGRRAIHNIIRHSVIPSVAKIARMFNIGSVYVFYVNLMVRSGLMQCHKRKVKVPEDEYEVTGTNVSPGNMAPRRARLNREKQVSWPQILFSVAAAFSVVALIMFLFVSVISASINRPNKPVVL